MGFEEAAKFFHGRQGHEVAGDEEFLIHASGGEFDLGAIAVAAQQDAYGWLIIVFHHVDFEPIDVEIHLSRIGRLEGSDLQIDEDMAAE